jgi:hypothetical protein
MKKNNILFFGIYRRALISLFVLLAFFRLAAKCVPKKARNSFAKQKKATSSKWSQAASVG